MADLFDINVGGAGFHLTSHIIALAALFIACFAITGYISFRDDSISTKKLKKGQHEEGVLDLQGGVYTYRKVVNLAAHPTNDVAAVVPLALASGTMIREGSLTMLDAGTGANAATTLDIYLHTSRLAAGDVGQTGNGATPLLTGMLVATQGNSTKSVNGTYTASAAAATVTQTEYVHLVYTTATAATMTTTPRVLVELQFHGPEPIEAL